MPLTATIAEQLRAKARIAPLPRRMRRAMTRASSTSLLASSLTADDIIKTLFELADKVASVQPRPGDGLCAVLRLYDPAPVLVYRRTRDPIVPMFANFYSDGSLSSSPAPAAIVDDLKPQE